MRHPGHLRRRDPLVGVESRRYISPYRSQEAQDTKAQEAKEIQEAMEEVRVRRTRPVPPSPVLLAVLAVTTAGSLLLTPHTATADRKPVTREGVEGAGAEEGGPQPTRVPRRPPPAPPPAP